MQRKTLGSLWKTLKAFWFSEFDELEKYKNCQDLSDYNSLVKRVKSLFVVVPTAPTENYKSFSEKVREYNKKKPFDFRTSRFPSENGKLLISFEKVITSTRIRRLLIFPISVCEYLCRILVWFCQIVRISFALSTNCGTATTRQRCHSGYRQ